MAIVEDDSEEEAAPAEAPLSTAAEAALKAADATREAGNAAFKASQYEVASDKYSAALEQLGDDVSHSRQKEVAIKCLNNRAACSCQLQQYRAAIRDCSSALEYNPRDAKALMRRGFAYESVERYTEALSDMRAVQSIEPSTQASAASTTSSTPL